MHRTAADCDMGLSHAAGDERDDVLARRSIHSQRASSSTSILLSFGMAVKSKLPRRSAPDCKPDDNRLSATAAFTIATRLDCRTVADRVPPVAAGYRPSV